MGDKEDPGHTSKWTFEMRHGYILCLLTFSSAFLFTRQRGQLTDSVRRSSLVNGKYILYYVYTEKENHCMQYIYLYLYFNYIDLYVLLEQTQKYSSK